MTSKRTKQKIVAQEVLYEYPLPEGDQRIVKVVEMRGNNLHQVETEDGERYLVSMPTKFRNWIWIKRGSFVIIEPIAEGNKVKGEILSILFDDQIRYIDDQKLWPEKFAFAVKRRGEDETYLTEDMLPPSSDEEEEFDDEATEESDSEDETEVKDNVNDKDDTPLKEKAPNELDGTLTNGHDHGHQIPSLKKVGFAVCQD